MDFLRWGFSADGLARGLCSRRFSAPDRNHNNKISGMGNMRLDNEDTKGVSAPARKAVRPYAMGGQDVPKIGILRFIKIFFPTGRKIVKVPY